MMIQLSRLNSGNSNARRICAALAVVWLNLAVLPCAMALQSDADRPHCPPSEQLEMASHHGEQESVVVPRCINMQADCCDIADVTIETRNEKTKSQLDDFAVLPPALTWQKFDVPTRVLRTVRPPDPGGETTPLHVLYCVYLD